MEGQKALLYDHCALHKFHMTDSQTRAVRLRVIEGPHVRDQIVFSAFHSFLVKFHTNAGYIHAMHV